MKKKKVYKKIVAVTVGAAIMVDAPLMNVFASEENTEVKNSEVSSLKGVIKQQDNSDKAYAPTSDSSKEGVTTRDLKVNQTIYLGGVGTSGAPTGDGTTPGTAYKYIDQAVDAAQDGDIIQLVGDTAIRAAQDTDGGSLPYRITKKVTFIGNSGNENMTWFRPIELGSDVTFQNLRITLPHTGAENNIFAAGYHLTLDNVATYKNGTIRPPYVYGGGYKDHALGNHAQITIRNANDDTKFSGVYAGSKYKDFVGDVTINIDSKTTIGDQNNQIGVYASGLRGRLPHGTIDYDYRVNGTVNINVTSNGKNSRIQIFDGFGATDANGNPSANLSLDGVNHQSFKAWNFNNLTLNNSTVGIEVGADFLGVSGNLEVVNNSKLDLSKSKITVVGGDFIGDTDANNAGIVQLSEDGLLDVAGTVIGNTSFMTPSIGSNVQGNPPMSGIVRENHTYIRSSANAVGEFLFKPYNTISQIHMSLEKEQDGGKTKWIARKEQHTLKDVRFEGKNRVTVDEVNEGNDEDDKGFILKVKSYDTNDDLFATAFEYKILNDQGQEVTDIEGYYHSFDGDKLVQYVKIAPTFMTASIGQYKLVLISEENGNTYEFDFEITATLTDTVTIEGDPKLGNTLTAKVDGLPQGVNEQDLTYQWYVNGVAVQGATGKTWAVNGNVDDEVYVEVSHANYANKLVSQAVTLLDKDQIVGTVTIEGDSLIGSTLTAKVEALPQGVNEQDLTYQWYVNGNSVAGATGKTWVVNGNIDDEVYVEVSHPNYSGVLKSQSVTIGKSQLTGQVTLPATVKVSDTLGANFSGLPNNTGALSYKWYVDGKFVSNQSFYTVPKEDLGKKITVELSAENYQGVIISNESTVIERDLTGTVAIIGTAEPGQTLTADTTGLPADAYDFTYQWYVDGKPVAGATQSTWVSDASNVGLPITVEVTAINYTSSVTSNPVILQKISIIGKGQVSITGTAEPGQTLTADTLGLPNDAGDLSYQWYVDGNPVPGATEKTWVSDASNVGLPITVEVTATNYNDRLQSAEVVLVKTALSGTVAINGTPKVGETLTAVLQNLPQDAGDLTYQWFANGNPIPNATNVDWIAEDGYADATITVQVSAKNYNNHVISNSVVLAKKDLTGTVTIDGMPQVGETLTANLQNVPNDAQNVMIKWFAGDKEIATGPTWVSTYDYVGQEITVRVTADNYAGELVSDKLTLAKKDLVGTITISGKPQFSETLTAVTAQLPADAQNIKYEWYVDAELVKDATSDTWTPGKDIVGKTVTVKVTADNYAGALTSTGVVLQAKDITGDVVINGINKPGNELKADITNLPVDAQNVSYQWYADGVAIPNATLSSWIVVGIYEGQTITVQVVADNYTGSATGVGVVVQPADKVPSVSIAGKPVVGSTLTSILQDLPADAQNVSYQWYANGVAIPNATSSSWVIEEAYAGQIITVKVKIDNFTSEIESLGIGVTHLEENSTNTDTNTPNTGDSTNVFMLLLMAFGAILTKVGILFKASKEKE